ncbi:MAG: gfo/Idh/MocA family oxidoreductase, partial [Thaumarchaeota archaeon]|nr:gfo/Idh/MocA family oxidoreductase [Nitrososphaerota archaeon]
SFLEAVESKSQPRVRAEQAVNVTKIAEAALLSSQKGVPVYIEL